MADSSDSTEPTGTSVSFVIDGRPFQTAERRRTAAAILRLADLDPGLFDLAELRAQRPEPVRFTAEELVEISEGARFVSIRRRADIA
jgi:hypothetical protein